MDSLWSVVLWDIYHQEWCVSTSLPIATNSSICFQHIWTTFLWTRIIFMTFCLRLQSSNLHTFDLPVYKWSFGVVLYEIFTIGNTQWTFMRLFFVPVWFNNLCCSGPWMCFGVKTWLVRITAYKVRGTLFNNGDYYIIFLCRSWSTWQCTTSSCMQTSRI